MKGKTKKSKSKDVKKRAEQNRLGEKGEKKFDAAAVDYGLVANHVANDYGYDFICAVDEDPTSIRPSSMSGDFVAVSVRATKQLDGRIKLNRADAGNLLRANMVTMVALVHLPHTGGSQIFVRILDATFRLELAEFLRSGRETVSFTPNHFEPIAEVRKLLGPALVPGFVQETRLEVLAAGLGGEVQGVRVQIRQNPDGSVMLVSAPNIFSLFEDAENEAAPTPRFIAAFGAPSRLPQRLVELDLAPMLRDNLHGLPSMLHVVGATEHETATWIASVDESQTQLELESLRTPGHTGWRHEAGWALVVSRPVEEDGQYVHHLQAFADPDVDLDLSDHPDLDAFLRQCVEKARVRRESWPLPGLWAWGFADLAAQHLFAVRMATIRDHVVGDSVGRPIAFLRDFADQVTARSLYWLEAVIVDGRHPTATLGFMINEAAGTPSDAAEVDVPVILTTSEATLVATLRCDARIAWNGTAVAGVQIEEVRNVSLEVRERADWSFRYPTFVFEPSLAIQVGESGWEHVAAPPSQADFDFRMDLRA